MLVEERLIEVPHIELVDVVREVAKPQVQKVPKHVQRPVTQCQEKIEYVPQVYELFIPCVEKSFQICAYEDRWLSTVPQ